MKEAVMKRLSFLIVLLLVVSLGTVFATGKGENAGSGGKSAVLGLATWHWAEPGRGAALKAMNEAYTKLNPNITFKAISVPWGRYVDQMNIQIAGGDAPDLMCAGDSMFYPFMARGYLAPLDDLINLKSLSKDFVETQKVAVVNGKTYGLNTENFAYALLYNNDMFKAAGITAPPKTLDEFMRVAKQLTKAPDQYGYGTRHSMNEVGGWWGEFTFWADGTGAIWAKNGKPTVNTPEVLAGVKYFKQLYDAGVFPKGVDAATYRRMFWEGKIGMLTDNQATLMLTKTQNPNIDFRAAPGPFDPPLTHAEIVFYTIPKASKNIAEAAKFLTWFYKNLGDYGLLVQNVVGSKSAVVKILEKYPFLRVFSELPVAFNGGTLPQGLEERLNEFRNIFLTHVSEVLINNADPQKEIDAAQAELVEKMK
jgi:multiple sugar transport system substrate-binding protein